MSLCRPSRCRARHRPQLHVMTPVGMREKAKTHVPQEVELPSGSGSQCHDTLQNRLPGTPIQHLLHPASSTCTRDSWHHESAATANCKESAAGKGRQAPCQGGSKNVMALRLPSPCPRRPMGVSSASLGLADAALIRKQSLEGYCHECLGCIQGIYAWFLCSS